jgi:hypothetical protein
MEHRYSPESIFATKVFEEYVKLSLENSFKNEWLHLVEKEAETEANIPIFIKSDASKEDVSYKAMSFHLLKVLQSIVKMNQSSLSLETIIKTTLELMFDQDGGHFKPRNNSAVGTR